MPTAVKASPAKPSFQVRVLQKRLELADLYPVGWQPHRSASEAIDALAKAHVENQALHELLDRFGKGIARSATEVLADANDAALAASLGSQLTATREQLARVQAELAAFKSAWHGVRDAASDLDRLVAASSVGSAVDALVDGPAR